MLSRFPATGSGVTVLAQPEAKKQLIINNKQTMESAGPLTLDP
jgi:hypothetical protein